jgi:hypothetical protein
MSNPGVSQVAAGAAVYSFKRRGSLLLIGALLLAGCSRSDSTDEAKDGAALDRTWRARLWAQLTSPATCNQY